MDYSRFDEFPFPSDLSEDDQQLKNYFMALTDEEQLTLLSGSQSYEKFHERVQQAKNSQPKEAAF